MKTLMLVAVVVAAGCQADNRNIERKLDEMSKDIKDLKQQVARGGAGAAAARPPQRAEPDRAKTYSMPVDNDPVDGPADAKVTLVKAYDYACPYCEKVRDTMDELRKKYGNDLRIVYKQLVVHPPAATVGALAACAAHKQGKFFDMDKIIWEKGFKGRQLQKDGAEGGGKCWEAEGGCPTVLGYAQELGLSQDKFKADMKGECQQLIQKDQRDLTAVGVGSTPTFFINGRYLVGAMPMENFVTLIDEELQKANEKIQAGMPQASYYQQAVLDKGLKQLEKPGQ
jgi:protein-disulfide isomerase